MRKLIFPLVVFLFCSCDKNKEMVRYTELYHIEGNDTISAIYIPNSFTPNADAINDDFIVTTNGVQYNKIVAEIYDKNGILVYWANELYREWDGKYLGIKVPNGEYICRVNATDYTGYAFEFTGSVFVLK